MGSLFSALLSRVPGGECVWRPIPQLELTVLSYLAGSEVIMVSSYMEHVDAINAFGEWRRCLPFRFAHVCASVATHRWYCASRAQRHCHLSCQGRAGATG
jgi:hypothetical protein